MYMHSWYAGIEYSNLLIIRGDIRCRNHRRLRTWIVERSERIRCGIDCYRSDIRPVQRIQVRHRGSVRPTGYIDAIRIYFASSYLLLNEVIDCRRVDILTIGSVTYFHIAFRIKLAIPIVPSDTMIVGKWIIVSSSSSLRSEYYVPVCVGLLAD